MAVILIGMMLCLNNGLRNWLEEKRFFLGFKNGEGKARVICIWGKARVICMSSIYGHLLPTLLTLPWYMVSAVTSPVRKSSGAGAEAASLRLA